MIKKMSDDTLYSAALKRLSSITSGSSDFEKICLILVKYLFPNYNFAVPEGGDGTKDGGYDGHDPLLKAKLACSLEKDYKRKIKKEVEKSKKNADQQLFYLSNQTIPETEKLRIKADPYNAGIDLNIFGIEFLSQKLDEYFQNDSGSELYDLLCLSFLKIGERYSRGDVKRLDINFNDIIYKKKIVIIDKNQNFNSASEETTGENPLLDYILSCCSDNKLSSFKNIYLCGIGCLGKSFLMRMTFNTLIDKFSDKSNCLKYQFLPFIQFLELKYYNYGDIEDIVKNNIDPLFIFMDGLDELNESNRKYLIGEIHKIKNRNNKVRFIIAGRNSSFFDFDSFSNSIQLYLEKFTDNNDKELMKLLDEYNGTPIADLLPIPAYRNFVLEKVISKDSKLEKFYNLLVKDNLEKDRLKRDQSNNISQRMTSEIDIDDIIDKISEFCYKLFNDGRNVFTVIELKEYIKNDSNFIFIIDSAIIDYRDKDNISFITNFYYEYFVSNALLSKGKKIINKIFFTRERIKILHIDLLVFFMNCAGTRKKNMYNFIKRKILKDDIVCILLCEFDLLIDRERYEYFISIYNSYKKERKGIYYGRFRQVYGPLKNIYNMAKRMQQLLLDSYKTDSIAFLKSEINKFLGHPSKKDVLSFGNAVILLIPYIKNIWTEKEQLLIKEIAVPIIKFFLNNDLSKELKVILSEYFIFIWYKDYNWTSSWKKEEWELFYKEISGKNCDLFSEIADDCEFRIKFNFLIIFYDDENIKLLIFPILRYAMKNMYNDGYSIAPPASEMITDENKTPLVKIDDRIYLLSNLTEKTDFCPSDILDLLIYAAENNIYQQIKDSFDNPVNILEEKLYKNLTFLEKKDHIKFTQYYFNIDEYEFDERIFQKDKTENNEELMIFLVNEITNTEVKKWQTGYFLHKIINIFEVNRSLKYLLKIKEKMPEIVYKEVLYYIFNNKEHVLNNSEFVKKEYNTLFEKEIKKNAEKERLLENVNKQIESVNKNDIMLMLDTNEMIAQLYKINEYLQSSKIIDKKRKPIGNIYSLYHETIKNLITNDRNEDTVPPIFSMCAIKIMEDHYRNGIINIDEIVERLQKYSFKENNFYIYFYWVYISNEKNKNKKEIKSLINTFPNLKYKILDSLNKDASNKFKNKSLFFFENSKNKDWLIPFFYYYENLLNNIPPEWMQIDHILKLIVVLDPGKSGGVIINHDLSINWLLDKFSVINPCQLIEYGLKNIENIKFSRPRIQITNYFIYFYKNNEKEELKEGILDFIINATKRMFVFSEDKNEYAEFCSISQFWTECNLNYIDRLFPEFSVDMITSTVKKNDEDIDYQYRKSVLLYCGRVATSEQKNRIINEIEKDSIDKELSDKENDEVNGFLASLGSEKSIRLIINSYLGGKGINGRLYYNMYPLGFIKQNCNMLKDFINLFVYSTEKSTERRDILTNIAKEGIKRHITKKSYKILEKRLLKEIKKFKKQYGWQPEYYNEFLLKMEQFVNP
jgi:hypothetical protein